MAKRHDARGLVQGRVEYQHAGGLRDGTLVDLARQGCRIKGASPPPCGVRLRLQLWLPDLTHPVTVDLAAVRWVKDDHFGVSFLEVSPDARTCLEQVCQEVLEPPNPKGKVISIPPFLASEGKESEVVSRGGPPMRKRPNS